MAKVAKYFNRWKNYTRHRKLNEEWAFATKMTDLSENGECFDTELEIYDVKFLGDMDVDEPRSEKLTAQTIKTIISKAKASNKKLQQLNLSVSPKGIETFDCITGETLHRISIYDISYCSADATHSNVFAFIAGNLVENCSFKNRSDDKLKCYAFYCSNRKACKQLTLAVAKTFERAYECWSKVQDRRKYSVDMVADHTKDILNRMEQKRSTSFDYDERDNDNNHEKSLLIDFGGDVEQQKRLMQNTWVSFEETDMPSF